MGSKPRIRLVNRSLLTPRWLLLHLLFVAAVVATALLGWWQWERAHEAGGSFQNLGYALQWPLFGVFTIYLWYRVATMELRGREAPDPADQPVTESTGAEADEKVEEPEASRRKRPLVPPPAPPVDAEEDPELAAYNRYLADLNSRDERR